MSVQIKIYDWKTAFNDTPVRIINDTQAKYQENGENMILVYKDGVFANIAHLMGLKSIDEWTKHYEEEFDRQDTFA